VTLARDALQRQLDIRTKELARCERARSAACAKAEAGIARVDEVEMQNDAIRAKLALELLEKQTLQEKLMLRPPVDDNAYRALSWGGPSPPTPLAVAMWPTPAALAAAAAPHPPAPPAPPHGVWVLNPAAQPSAANE